jgi:hypothetical protein
MKSAGLQYFAWIYSHSAMSRLSADEAIRNMDGPAIVKTFDEKEEAKRWLMQNDPGR